MQTTSGLVAARGSLVSPEETEAIWPEYLDIAERLHELIHQGGNTESGLQEIATEVASLSDSDQGKAALVTAVAEAQWVLGLTGDVQ